MKIKCKKETAIQQPDSVHMLIEGKSYSVISIYGPSPSGRLYVCIKGKLKNPKKAFVDSIIIDDHRIEEYFGATARAAVKLLGSVQGLAL